MLTKVLIANRGEIAVRIARTCRRMGLATVAVFSDADEHALHVEVADEAVRLPGAAPADTYLARDAVIAAARRAGADAVHPGYGFLSEDPVFARAVGDAGLVWVGPTPAAIEAMGDKITAKRTMADAGVPLVPGEVLDGSADVRVVGERVGYPLLVKAAAGGGGRGMRTVADPDGLEDAVAGARREAASAFGDDRVFLERLLTSSRHVEVQVLADAHGGVVHLFERECSIQRRHQKVLEEAPSPGIDEDVRAAMCDAAVAAARAIDYVGAGTVEFIVDERAQERRRRGEDVDASQVFAFLEMNTRLQVEHPVTEETVRLAAGGAPEPVDLVRLQLLVAAGEPLPFAQDDLHRVGHAVEARIYAEDPTADYLPATGTLVAVDWPRMPGLRVDAGVRTGDAVSPHYDAMLAKVVGVGATRAEAAGRLARALAHTALLGVTTNRDLLVRILRDDAFLAGATTTAYLDERFADPAGRGGCTTPDEVEAAVLATGCATAGGGGGAAPVGFASGAAMPVEAAYAAAGRTWHLQLREQRAGHFRVRLDGGAEHDVGFRDHGRGWCDLEVDGLRRRLRVVSHGTRHQVLGVHGAVELVEQPRFPEVAATAAAGVTTSPMPGSVVAVAVAVGDDVVEGTLLVTVEAMKMEHRVVAPFPGRVSEVRVEPGRQVEADEILVIVEG